LATGFPLCAVRRDLLQYYLDLLDSSRFISTRQCVCDALASRADRFDRQQYLNQLIQTYNGYWEKAVVAIDSDPINIIPISLPGDFVTWILEWPEKAALEFLWPGFQLQPASRFWDLSDGAQQLLILSSYSFNDHQFKRFLFPVLGLGCITAGRPGRHLMFLGSNDVPLLPDADQDALTIKQGEIRSVAMGSREQSVQFIGVDAGVTHQPMTQVPVIISRSWIEYLRLVEVGTIVDGH
jgi:hypothetical protein